MDFEFFPVTLAESETLFQWRNDEQTRLASLNSDLVTWESHQKWFEQVLKNPDRSIFLVKFRGAAVGTLRADQAHYEGQMATELSWTIAPSHRGLGYGSQILKQFVLNRSAVFIAKIKAENSASLRMAEKAGFRLAKAQNGLTTWIYENQRS